MSWPALLLFLALQDPAFQELTVRSTSDGTDQPARWYEAKGVEPAPLIVLLHTWSNDYRQKAYGDEALRLCAERNWHLVMPNFRGPNVRPEACASDAAVQDVLDAVVQVRAHAKVDPLRIYAVGTSGGGHMALMMASKAPKLWAGISSWVPVTDLAAWHGETKAAGRKYWKDLEGVCGGAPGASSNVDAEYRKRSPLTHLSKARSVTIDLNVGIHDGYTGSIPVTHSLRAFNVLAEANGVGAKKLGETDLEFMRTQRKVPERLAAEREDDSTRRHPVLFRRAAGPVRLTVFEGSHEGDMKGAFAWLAGLRRTP